MTQELIILGVLKNNPASGYDIKKFMEKELGAFSKVEAQSIYYCLKKMEKGDLVKKHYHQGLRHLNRYIYSITPKGQKQFFALCKETLLSQRRPFMELDVALYFLPLLNKKEILPFLRLRLWFLERVKRWLLNKEGELQKAPRNLILLVKHHFKLATAEGQFLEEMIRAIKKGEV